jgi:uncharacterized membrane protein
VENKHAGMLVVGIGAVMAAIVWIFNAALKNIVDETCSHGSECTMFDTIQSQTGLSLAIVAVILVIGLVIMLTKPKVEIKEKIVVKKVKEKKKKLDLDGLDENEKKAVELIQAEGKAMFQADLMEKLEIGKVGMTRLLDKLEAKQFIERKRRGMNNIVVMKDG